jgi:hypothetical protein
MLLHADAAEAVTCHVGHQALRRAGAAGAGTSGYKKSFGGRIG